MNRVGFTLPLLVLLVLRGLMAAEVVLVQQAHYGDKTVELCRSECDTGLQYETVPAPTFGGYIFTHWSATTCEKLVARDILGRSYESAKIILFDHTTLTANYVEDSLDADNDGIPDGHELYWYGNIEQEAWSDTDGDGVNFAAELQFGTNPLMSDTSYSGIESSQSEICLYNPENYHQYKFVSEPEGVLFESVVGYAKFGDKVISPICNRRTSFFSFWQMDGNAVRDSLNRAVDVVSFAMPDRDVECVAITVEDGIEREKLYWYGSKEVSELSDTDGDGLSFEAEIAAGTNPLLAESSFSGVVSESTDKVTYSQSSGHRCVIKSYPEGAYFVTVNVSRSAGEIVSTPPECSEGPLFAYWTKNGVRQGDVFGRAFERLTFEMPDEDIELVAHYADNEALREQLYWYGFQQSLESDTDGDGRSFGEELAAGTNPHLPDSSYSGVTVADGTSVEMNLQAYERVPGIVIDNCYENVFSTSSHSDVSTTFFDGMGVCPYVLDLNSDGLFDVVVEDLKNQNRVVFINCGSRGNPEFKSADWQPDWRPLVESSQLKSVERWAFDIEPESSLSYSKVGSDLLVSDVDGRIWFYLWNGSGYELQHKVWGGTYAGFAKGLRIAAVDWEDDGDWDCLCGTADGKLMLLRDPKIGRPTNLLAKPGVDNVLLEWDPNQQSRVRGYKVYRNETESGDDGDVIGEPKLPRYRDWPPVIKDYEYRVSAFGRFYTAGNSEPEIVESPLTDPVRVVLGKVSLSWNDATAFAGDEVGVSLSIENSLSLSGSGLVLKVEYDSKVLTPVRIQKSGLTEGIVLNDTVADGQWSICSAGGEMAAGGGTMLTLVFMTSDFVAETNTTSVGLAFASMKTVSGADISIAMPLSQANVVIVPSQNPSGDPTVVPPYGRGDVNGDGRLTKEDLQLMARLMKGGPNEKWNSNQLDAGDYNDDGSLDQNDYKLMRDDFRAKGIINGGEKMGVL